jgi:hypothetical protein
MWLRGGNSYSANMEDDENLMHYDDYPDDFSTKPKEIYTEDLPPAADAALILRQRRVNQTALDVALRSAGAQLTCFPSIKKYKPDAAPAARCADDLGEHAALAAVGVDEEVLKCAGAKVSNFRY